MNRFKKHGHAVGGTISKTYISWNRMKDRCTNKNNLNYDNYGGRGISFCDRWKKFKAFLEDMGQRPDGKTIDRIDVNGNYEPSNCRWADAKTQRLNQRKAQKPSGGRDA